MSDLRDVTLVVLAGGAGSRMGRAKGELVVRGRPILRHLMEGFAWDGPTLLVTAPGREGPPGAELFEREVSDAEEGMGALGGIVTALENLRTAWAAVCVVDMPGVSGDVVRWLAAQRRGMGVMVRRAERVEPFPCVVSREALAAVRERYERGERAVKELPQMEGFHLVEAPGEWGEGVWVNLNRPGDVEAFERGF